jgi:hypothetical protein
MLPRTSGRLIDFAVLLACSASLLCPVQQAESAAVRYHIGDDPDGKLGWVNPGFDDSAWLVAKDGRWPMPPFYPDGPVLGSLIVE